MIAALTVWKKYPVKSTVRVAVLLMLVWVASTSLARANICKADLDGDGDVDESDMAVFFAGFGRMDYSGVCSSCHSFSSAR